MSENVPEHCPGTESEDAGKALACAGCPNQNICASGEAKGPDPGIAQVKERLANVKHKVLILSGKGGVGKSTLSALLGRALAAKFPDKNIGVLDVDICGPSQPRVLGASGEQVHHSGSGWSPVYIEDNLSLMSIGFLLGSPDDAIIWRGPKKNGMIKQFLTEVDWGQLDFLLIDTPPDVLKRTPVQLMGTGFSSEREEDVGTCFRGTSDEHLSLVTYLSSGEDSGLAGAILVTTPQEMSLLDVRKEITFCKKLGVPILGIIENMSSFVCPKCQTESEIFPRDPAKEGSGVEGTGVNLLGRLPLDPRLAYLCDLGQDPITEMEHSPAVNALNIIIDNFLLQCKA